MLPVARCMSAACPSLRLQNPFDDAPKSLAEVYKLRSALPPSPPNTRIHTRTPPRMPPRAGNAPTRPPAHSCRPRRGAVVCSKKSRKRNHKRALAEADGEADDDGAADDSRAGAAREGK